MMSRMGSTTTAINSMAVDSSDSSKYKEMEESISSCVRLSLSCDNGEKTGAAAMDTLVSALKPFRKKVRKRQKKAAKAEAEAEAEQQVEEQEVIDEEETTESESTWATEDDELDLIRVAVAESALEKKLNKQTSAMQKAVEEGFAAMTKLRGIMDAKAKAQEEEETTAATTVSSSSSSSNGRRRNSSNAEAPSRIPRRTAAKQMPPRLKSLGNTKSSKSAGKKFKRSLSLGANLAGTGLNAPSTTTKEPDFDWQSNSDHRRQSIGSAASAASASAASEERPDFDWQTYHTKSSASKLPPKSNSKSSKRKSGLRRCKSHASEEVMKANKQTTTIPKGTLPVRAKSFDKETSLGSTTTKTSTIPDLMSYQKKGGDDSTAAITSSASARQRASTITSAADVMELIHTQLELDGMEKEQQEKEREDKDNSKREQALRRRASSMAVSSSVSGTDVMELIHSQVELDGMEREEQEKEQEDLLDISARSHSLRGRSRGSLGRQMDLLSSSPSMNDDMSIGSSVSSLRRQGSVGELDLFMSKKSSAGKKSALRRQASLGQLSIDDSVDDSVSLEAVSPPATKAMRRMSASGTTAPQRGGGMQRRASCSSLTDAPGTRRMQQSPSSHSLKEDDNLTLKQQSSHSSLDRRRMRSSSLHQGKQRTKPSSTMDMSSSEHRRPQWQRRERSTSRHRRERSTSRRRRRSGGGRNTDMDVSCPSVLPSARSFPRNPSRQRLQDNDAGMDRSLRSQSHRRFPVNSSRQRRSSMDRSCPSLTPTSTRRGSTAASPGQGKKEDCALDMSFSSLQSKRSSASSSRRRIMDDASSGSQSAPGRRGQQRRRRSCAGIGMKDMSSSNNGSSMRRSRRGTMGTSVRNFQLQQTLDAPPMVPKDLDKDNQNGVQEENLIDQTNFASAFNDDSNPTPASLQESSTDPTQQKVTGGLSLESLEQRSRLSMFKRQQSLSLIELESVAASDDHHDELGASSSIASFFDGEGSEALLSIPSQPSLNNSSTSPISVVLPMVEARPQQNLYSSRRSSLSAAKKPQSPKSHEMFGDLEDDESDEYDFQRMRMVHGDPSAERPLATQ